MFWYYPVGTTKFVLYREVKCIVSFIKSVFQERFYCTEYFKLDYNMIYINYIYICVCVCVCVCV